MENVFSIRSKAYVKPLFRNVLFKQLLNICLAITLFAGIVQILFDGISIRGLGQMALAYVVVKGYNSRPKANEHYEPTIADIEVDSDKIVVDYKQIKGYKYSTSAIEVKYNDITALEYSDQNCYLHIVGNICIKEKETGAINEQIREYDLYLEKGMEEEILACIEKNSNLKIRYLDR